MDAPHQAKSGHQGTAMALAPLAHVLFTRILKYSAEHPGWSNRDRFVLSIGHASILQYAMLYLTGYGVTLNDIKEFRQWDSMTPGHPEVGHTPGVEVTTGPLGQGFANAVGMAISERWLRSEFGAQKIDHRIYALCGDGDLSEGVSHEAASFAGQQRLGRLICVYDDNHVTIDGPTELALRDDPAKRFESYGWQVIDLGESAEDLDAIENAFNEAASNETAPTLIILRSHIGFPSPTLTDAPSAHGYAFKSEEIEETKAVMGIPPDQSFFVPDEVLDLYRQAGRRNSSLAENYSWEPDKSYGTWSLQGVDDQFENQIGESIATRVASGSCLNQIVPDFAMIAGGADLTGNTGTALKGVNPLSFEHPGGKQIYFGVREHAMGAIMNGVALHEGVIPVGGTFLVFSDYMRPSIRLAALTQAKVIYSFTHDSVGVGEDGPTHQPIEHIMALRSIPNLRVIRPADAKETSGAWKVALQSDGPTALILSRQGLPILAETSAETVQAGAYVLREASNAVATLIATGSEVSLCIKAADQLEESGTQVRVVSLPSFEIFEQECSTKPDYKKEVLPPELPIISVEAGITLGWERYADLSIGIDRFGASAPGDVVMDKLGINVETLITAVQTFISGGK